VSCWEVHLPGANHREAWALERTAPTRGAAAEPAPERTKRRVVPSAPARSAPARAQSEAPREILVIASRLKEYVRASSGMSTSDRVLDPLSDIVRRLCDEAIRNASREGRRTVLDRDVPRV